MIVPEDATVIGFYGYRSVGDRVPNDVRLKIKPFCTKRWVFLPRYMLTPKNMINIKRLRKTIHKRSIRVLVNKNGK